MQLILASSANVYCILKLHRNTTIIMLFDRKVTQCFFFIGMFKLANNELWRSVEGGATFHCPPLSPGLQTATK